MYTNNSLTNSNIIIIVNVKDEFADWIHPTVSRVTPQLIHIKEWESLMGDQIQHGAIKVGESFFFQLLLEVCCHNAICTVIS